MLDGSKPAARVLWQGPGEQDQEFTHDTENTLNSVISTPAMDGAYVYGIDNDGQLRDARRVRLSSNAGRVFRLRQGYGGPP